MCNISFCEVDSKVDQYFQPTLYIIVIVLGLPTNCMALWAAYMQVRHSHARAHTRTGTLTHSRTNHSHTRTRTHILVTSRFPFGSCLFL